MLLKNLFLKLLKIRRLYTLSEKITFLRDWLGWIVGIILTIFSLITAFSTDFINSNPFHFTLICVTGFGLLTVAIWFVIYFYKQQSFSLLYNLESINKKIIEYSQNPDFNTLIYIGDLKESIVKTICDNYGSNTQVVKIISSSPDAYGRISDQLKKDLFIKEAKEEDTKFINKFYSHAQLMNVFIALNKKNYPHTLIFFKNRLNTNDYIGFLSKNSDFNIDTSLIEDNSFSMNVAGIQEEIAQKTAIVVDNLWEAFKEGFFEPLFPPLENGPVRNAWREEILKNFNDFAIRLIRSGNYSHINITWNLTKNSEKDKIIFDEWMKEQINTVKDSDITMSISRYLIINTLEYANDNDYKKIVDKIVKELKSISDTIPNYNLHYVCAQNISAEAKNDYALLTGTGNEEIIQSSIIDKSSSPDVLKVYFSKNNNSITRIKKNFETIEDKAVDDFVKFKSQFNL